MGKRKKSNTKRHGGALTKMRSGMRAAAGTQRMAGRKKQSVSFMQVMGGVITVAAVLMMVWAMR